MTTTSVPSTSGPDTTAAVVADNVVVDYRTRSGKTHRALHGVSIEIAPGETLGLVGESGSGKSTLGKSIAQLPPPTGGKVFLRGTELTALSTRQLRPMRHGFQMIFQDPISSLNPRRTCLEIVAEPLKMAGRKDAEERAKEILAEVGVREEMARRRPHELSGGQCQRVSIARALIQEPEILICDEPVSALDVSVQAQVLNLLEQMKADRNLAMLFISHDLSVVANISDRVAVLYLGRIVELAESTALYAQPRHHYTSLLLASIPNSAHPKPAPVPESAGQAGPSAGCPFAPRCPAATAKCWSEEPALVEITPGRQVACHHPV